MTKRPDLSTLYTHPADPGAILNGTACTPETRHLLVIAKLWPKLYEIELGPPPRPSVVP